MLNPEMNSGHARFGISLSVVVCGQAFVWHNAGSVQDK